MGYSLAQKYEYQPILLKPTSAKEQIIPSERTPRSLAARIFRSMQVVVPTVATGINIRSDVSSAKRYLEVQLPRYRRGLRSTYQRWGEVDTQARAQRQHHQPKCGGLRCLLPRTQPVSVFLLTLLGSR